MRHVLVTGGAGFIGAHLVRALVARGDAVRIVDNLVTGTAGNLSAALNLPLSEVNAVLRHAVGRAAPLTERCTVIVGDICDSELIGNAYSGIDLVFHQAALRSVPRSVAAPLAAHEANVTGTLRVLEAARSSGVRRVVNASSSSVYGDTPLPKHEGQPPRSSQLKPCHRDVRGCLSG